MYILGAVLSWAAVAAGLKSSRSGLLGVLIFCLEAPGSGTSQDPPCVARGAAGVR